MPKQESLQSEPPRKERRVVDVGPCHRSLLKRMFFRDHQFGRGRCHEDYGRIFHNFGNPDLAVNCIGETRRRLGRAYGMEVVSDLVGRPDYKEQSALLRERQRQAEIISQAILFGQFFIGNQFTKMGDPELDKEIKRRLHVREGDIVRIRPATIWRNTLGSFIIAAENPQEMGTVFFDQEALWKEDPRLIDQVREECRDAILRGRIVLLQKERERFSGGR